MNLGISSACFYPELTEKAIEKLCSHHIPVIELFYNSFCECSPSFLEGIKKQTDDANITIKALHPFSAAMESYFLFSDYERRWQDGTEMYRMFFENAQRLGADFVIMHGDRCTNRIDNKAYFERYAALYQLGKQYQITLVQENVVGYRSQHDAFISEMHHYLGDQCAFVFDIKQAARAHQDPVAMLQAMGDRLVHMHLSDNTEHHTCLLPLKGTCDFRKIVNLTDAAKRCSKVVEVYRDAYRDDDELFSSYRALCHLLET